VPLVAITGQVPRKLIGTDGFQETPIVEVTRQITKHNYLVMDVNDIPRVIKVRPRRRRTAARPLLGSHFGTVRDAWPNPKP